ncbi:hypothetical protein COHA_005579 [Chlorella ohadii]|uniref:Retrotransposon gag domain-containing protein n=1 Tax=Chlorella ohadii TaxID=2649997 RepID=A0AAD5DRR9_9CHLO|nr:hypothetical protein COHA_005579 [Chlorella ohadii]
MASPSSPAAAGAAAAAAAAGAAAVRPASSAAEPTFGLQIYLEKFSGKPDQNPESFIQTISNAKRPYGWLDSQALAYAGLNLKGRALNWYNLQPPMT